MSRLRSLSNSRSSPLLTTASCARPPHISRLVGSLLFLISLSPPQLPLLPFFVHSYIHTLAPFLPVSDLLSPVRVIYVSFLSAFRNQARPASYIDFLLPLD